MDDPQVEIIADEALLAEIEAKARGVITADAAWLAAGKPPLGPERVALFDAATDYAKMVREPALLLALVEELRVAREAVKCGARRRATSETAAQDTSPCCRAFNAETLESKYVAEAYREARARGEAARNPTRKVV